MEDTKREMGYLLMEMYYTAKSVKFTYEDFREKDGTRRKDHAFYCELA